MFCRSSEAHEKGKPHGTLRDNPSAPNRSLCQASWQAGLAKTRQARISRMQLGLHSWCPYLVPATAWLQK